MTHKTSPNDYGPVVKKIRLVSEFAGVATYVATIAYKNSEPEHVWFKGPGTGLGSGPTYTLIDNVWIYVVRSERFGKQFNGDWIRNYFA